MTAEQLLVEHWRDLPLEKRQQVIDFVDFLRDRHSKIHTAQTSVEKPTKRRRTSSIIAGKGKTIGDIVSPLVAEEDWECLK